MEDQYASMVGFACLSSYAESYGLVHDGYSRRNKGLIVTTSFSLWFLCVSLSSSLSDFVLVLQRVN